ncbi:MAG: ABC transporter permease [Halobacteriota archaeon]
MRSNLRSIALVAEKEMRIYYTKPPVLIFGFLFPFFMFFAFYFGRSADLYTLFPGLAAMFVFFVASSVGPLITPWEKRAGTYERLLSFPVTINTLILGDVVAGMLYGIVINVIILAVGTAAFGYAVSATGVVLMGVSLVLGAFCFSALGVLLASPASTNPGDVMMLSSLVRFPLIFISGIFVPIASLQGIARVAVYCSPITYLVAGFDLSLLGSAAIPIGLTWAALIGFSVVFVVLASVLHRRNLMKGL